MSGETKSAAELAAETKAAFDKSLDAVKEIAEAAAGKAEAGEQLSQKAKDKADEALVTMNELKAGMTELEQKLDRGGNNDADEAKSIGQMFVESDEFKSFEADGFSRNNKARIEAKATITLATTDTDGAVGAGVRATRLPGIQELPQRRMTIRDLLMPGRMDGNTLEYVQETGFNNNAAMVAEGAVKPQSDIKLADISTSAKVIAHHFKASRQSLSDVAQLRSLIDQRGRMGLKLKEEGQLLNGDGTGQNLMGLIPSATAYAAAFAVTAETIIDKLRLAMLQAALAEYPATGHVLNPIDWARIELTKDGDNNYIVGGPTGDALAPTLWRLPVVETQAMQVDKFLTGAFQMGAQIFDRWLASVETGYVDDDFVRNLITILFEERLALAIYRPEAFIYGDLGFVA
ncbi:phage major capsid protein [uncultured Pelagimonas sp.]|uniref:phage major capsid protein n=1 Tax=uncultured Pelagimonas sp. TaxID=1618102 RepID=UPI00262A61DC|nr:phage major capsid protein [uncultured Pelagimonas sp.]